MVFVVRTDLGMGKGKIAAQVAHAAVELYKKADKKTVEEWEREGAKKVVLKVRDERELLEWYDYGKRCFPAVLIRDAGHTQIVPGTITVAGFGPGKDEEMDKVFRELPLL